MFPVISAVSTDITFHHLLHYIVRIIDYLSHHSTSLFVHYIMFNK